MCIIWCSKCVIECRLCSLQALKGILGFPLIRFEDAVINMYPYTRVHPYETQEMVISDILKHFREVGNSGDQQWESKHCVGANVPLVSDFAFSSPLCDVISSWTFGSPFRSWSVRQPRSWAQWTSWATLWGYWMMSQRAWMNWSSMATSEDLSAVWHMVFPTLQPR